MKKILALLVLTLLASACSKKTETVTQHYQLPPEMKDCQIYDMSPGGLDTSIVAIRCPNSTVTTTRTTIDDDGIVDKDIAVVQSK